LNKKYYASTELRKIKTNMQLLIIMMGICWHCDQLTRYMPEEYAEAM